MKSYPQENQQRHPDRPRIDVRRLVFAFLSVVLFLGQSTATMAGHGADGSSIWVEICSNGETYLAQVDQGDGGQEPDCEQCLICLVSIGDTVVLWTPETSWALVAGLGNISFPENQINQPVRPENYWFQSRGPPTASKEKIMTITTTLAINEPVMIATNSWGFPWV